MDPRDTKLDELEISIRTYNCFKNQGFETIGDVLALDEGELLRIPNFGRKSLNEVSELFRGFGLRIAGKSKRYIAFSLPSDVYEKLKARAIANERSVEKEAAAALALSVGADPSPRSIVDRIAALERAVFRIAPVQFDALVGPN